MLIRLARHRVRTMVAVAAAFAGAQTARADAPAVAAAVATPVTFLSVEDARKAIVDDSADPYFDKLTPHEMTAKTGGPITGDTPEAQRAECRVRYQAACDSFTDEEREALSALLGQIHPAVERAYPRFAQQPWSFLKVKPTLEGGMPHTRGGHIVVSERFLAGMQRLHTQGDEAGARVAARVLVHEQTHVVERAHPEWFAKLFTEVLGFRRAKSIEGDPWLTARQLVNPDGADVNWVFPIKSGDDTRWVWPLLAFDDPEATSLQGMKLIAVDVEPVGPGTSDVFKSKRDAAGEPVHAPLQTVDEYMNAVRTRRNCYHPNEIAADLLSELVTRDVLAGGNAPAGDGDDEANQRLAPVRAWARETLGPAE